MTKRGNELHDEMLEAFLAIEPQDAHVGTRRAALADGQRPVVKASVALRRSMSGATGVSERPPVPIPVKLASREVDNPHMTDGLYYGSEESRRNTYAKIRVEENALTRLGALCFIRRRERHHEQVAAMFKNLYEARYGSAMPAVDPSREPVDTSKVAHDGGMAARLDRTAKIEGLEDELGKPAYDRLVALLVLGIPAGSDAPLLPSGRPNDRAVKRATDLVLGDIDTLAELPGWDLKSRAA